MSLANNILGNAEVFKKAIIFQFYTHHIFSLNFVSVVHHLV